MRQRIYKPKDGSIGFKQNLSDEQAISREKAINSSPDINKLSEPFITDGGRTMIYFKKGSDPQVMGQEFMNRVNEKQF